MNAAGTRAERRPKAALEAAPASRAPIWTLVSVGDLGADTCRGAFLKANKSQGRADRKAKESQGWQRRKPRKAKLPVRQKPTKAKQSQ